MQLTVVFAIFLIKKNVTNNACVSTILGRKVKFFGLRLKAVEKATSYLVRLMLSTLISA